ncbi:hypothetical protein AgCh_023918 [Apium graveolens]
MCGDFVFDDGDFSVAVGGGGGGRRRWWWPKMVVGGSGKQKGDMEEVPGGEIFVFPAMISYFESGDYMFDDGDFLEVAGAVKLIIEFETPLQLQQLINDDNCNKFDQYLHAVVEFQRSIKSGLITGYETHGTRAIKSLQLVFRGILDCSTSATATDAMSSTLYSSSYGYDVQERNLIFYSKFSSEQVHYLRSIVEKLNSIGCLGDCIDLYRISRKSAVDARFLWFRIENWTINDLQNLDCEQFTAKIRIWIQATYICYNSIFPGERQQYEQIFDGVRAVTYENCFVAIVEHAAIELNNFSDAEDKQQLEALGRTPLGVHVIWIITSLRINLESKSRIYSDSSLRNVFIMNNVDYVLKTITGSLELVEIIGEEYLSLLSNDVAQATQDYSLSIWNKVLYCLGPDGLSYKFLFYHGIWRYSLKTRFSTFNTTFEEQVDASQHHYIRNIVLAPKTDDLIIPGFHDIKDSNCEDTKFPHKELAENIIIASGSPLNLEQLINDARGNKLNKCLCAADEMQQSMKSGSINNFETHGTCASETVQPLYQGILECLINTM